MRIDANCRTHDYTDWRVIDCRTDMQMSGVVWADDEDDTYGVYSDPPATVTISAPKVIISTGLKIVWLYAKPDSVDIQEPEAVTAL